MTRYARALRDMKLQRVNHLPDVVILLLFLTVYPLTGETGTNAKRKYYCLLYRLLEGEDESDPLGDEIRSILEAISI